MQFFTQLVLVSVIKLVCTRGKTGKQEFNSLKGLRGTKHTHTALDTTPSQQPY
jgi:hypothetical protein